MLFTRIDFLFEPYDFVVGSRATNFGLLCFLHDPCMTANQPEGRHVSFSGDKYGQSVINGIPRFSVDKETTMEALYGPSRI